MYSARELAPTAKQLAYIKRLAAKRGMADYPAPHDRTEASEEIEFLKGVNPGYQCSHGKRWCRPCEKDKA